MQPTLRSYGKIYALGHGAISELFFDDVVIEEKVDGSQFSFGVIDGELLCRSKGKDQNPNCYDGLFKQAVQSAEEIAPNLKEGWIYRSEYLASPHHNTLAYPRTPKNHLIIFDIDTGIESFITPEEKRAEADRIGLECVPVLEQGKYETYDAFKKLLSKTSCLGDIQVEGVVIKNYHRFGRDKHILMGKYVNSEFIEEHRKQWGESHKSGKGVVALIGESLRTEARWHKAIQHMKERGELTNSPKDIGPLLKEINKDIMEECAENIKEQLFRWAWKDVARAAVKGFPYWYKELLVKSQFE